MNPRLKSLADRILPTFLLGLLDPVRHLIDDEVARAASSLRAGGVVLDAGAGEARHRKHFRSARYIAVDTGSGDPGWDYSKLDLRGDLEQLPLRPGTVDLILCMVVLEHTRNPRGVLEEFARVLKRSGSLVMVVPFLWEEHQAPHDYFRFTRYGVIRLFESLPLQVDLVEPMGGFFRVAARRCINLLSFFQHGWRWSLFVLLAPFFGLLFPLILHFMDGLDREKRFTLGFRVRASKGGVS